MEPGKPGPVGVGGVGGGAATSEGVLASFFNSLLSKKTGQGIPGQPGGQISPARNDNEDCERTVGAIYFREKDARFSDKAAALRSDAATELDRLTRSQKGKVGGVAANNSADNNGSLNNSSSEC
jgi:hypothetical protein